MFLRQYLAPFLLITIQICRAQTCEEFTDLDFGHAFIGTSLKIKLLLYTRENATCGILVSHTNLTAHPQFNLSRPTTFVIHGYRPTGSPPNWIHNITEMLLSRGDMNVIIVDWNHGAANVNYFKAVENTHKAGDNLTDLMKKLQEQGVSLQSVHLIGVSLGAHISGFIGAALNGTIGRITALDPAGPLFTGNPLEDRLDPTDAQFVDVLHTDIDGLGFREPLGHIDFYANGGTDQPGCPKTIFSGGSYFKCDHQRSVFLYLESEERKCASRAYPCPSYSDYVDGQCLNCDRFGATGCPVFGYDIIKWKDVLLRLGQTKTYFSTNEKKPFCMTNYIVDIVTWNQQVHWGYITVKLFNGSKEAVATIDQKTSKFKKFTQTKLLAQFDKRIQAVKKISLKFTTGKVFKPTYKLRVLRMRLMPIETKDRPLCRYDILLPDNEEVTFRPIPCEEHNF